MTEDTILITRAQTGDLAAFKTIFERNKENVFRTAFDMLGSREDAEDVSQEVFLKAHRSLVEFRGDAKLSTWLYRITINACHDLMSRKAYKTTRPTDPQDEKGQGQPLFHSDAGASPGRTAESALIGHHIEKALEVLTPRERAVFVLRHYEDLPMKDIASILNIADGTVRSILFRALQRLQKELSQYKTDLGLEGSR